MSLEDLLKRVDESSGPDHELDAHLYCTLRGLTMHEDTDPKEGIFAFWENGVCHNCSSWPNPTESLDEALDLVEEQMAREWPSYEVHARMVRSGGEWFHFFEITVPSREFQGRSRHASIALLQCLLRALISQKEGVE